MTIQVVCKCGFSKEVPDHWKGMRVKCKCGRSFVISDEGCIEEPPVAAPPLQPTEGSPAASPTRRSAEGTARPDSPLDISSHRKRDSVAARYHARHDPTNSRKRMVIVGGAVVAVVCLGALAVVLRDKIPTLFQSTAQLNSPTKEKQPVAPANPAGSDTTKPESPSADLTAGHTPAGTAAATTSGTSGTDAGAKQGKSALADETGRLHNRIAEVIELKADDGLLLTGMFGDANKQLTLSEEQTGKVTELTKQVRAHEDALVAGDVDLGQWYVDGEKTGNELLAVLTDDQQTRLRKLIEQQKIVRVRLEDYAARLRPELKIPIISWKIEPDGEKRSAIKECAIAGTTNGKCIRSVSANRFLAFASGTSGSETSGNAEYAVWDLVTNNRVGNRALPPPKPGETTVIAQDGPFVVRGGKTDDGGYRLQAWPIPSGAAKTRDAPKRKGDDAATGYQLVGCAANRVVCVSDRDLWIWYLDTDKTRKVDFPDWVPHGMPKCAFSPGGQYMVLAHRHNPVIESTQYHFLEVGIYELETGDLLGNQVVATDYQPFEVGAIALSDNGRGLALLWDIEPPAPKRMLIHMSALVGELIETIEDIPAAQQGYAQQHNLQTRDLMWLPDNSGWIVNLQSLIESESGSVIEIELPTSRSSGGTNKPDLKNIVDAVPAGNNRLLLITVEPEEDDSSKEQVKSQFLELPEMGPFM